MTGRAYRQDTRAEAFNEAGSSWLERALFGHRIVVLVLCALATLWLGWATRGLTINASFDATVPQNHPFVQAYELHKDDIHSQANALRIAVEVTDGTIFTRSYLETLRELNDAVFLLPGVDRSYMKSLWTPATRWLAVTEDGFESGPVMPDTYDGSDASVSAVRANVVRSGEIGQLVAPDFKSSLLFVPLLDRDPATGQPLDYGALSRDLERLRAATEALRPNGSQGFVVRITGFAKVAGDLIAGLRQIAAFFAISVAITTAAVYLFTRCVRSTLLVVVCSMVAVSWQLGLLVLAGFHLDPYSILVPFLVFAIGMSHGAQKMNGVMRDIGRGLPSLAAARMTFRRLFLAGFTALACDAVGFAVLLTIDIRAIRNLALVASMGVAILVVTNLVLLPVLLSYVGVSRAAAARSLAADRDALPGTASHRVWRALGWFTGRRGATIAVGIAVTLGAAGALVATQLKIGDLEPGAPELRADSVYNRDNAYLTRHYALSSDVLAVMVTTPDGECTQYGTEQAIDAFEWQLRRLPGVGNTASIASLSRGVIVALNEGSPLWNDLIPNQGTLNSISLEAPREMLNGGCNLLPVYIYLSDHKAETLTRIVAFVREFAASHDTDSVHFLLAAGNAGIEAATNDVVEGASRTMLLYVYAAVILLSLITFRSWRGVLVAILPLALTSILAQALMVVLGMGVKVGTLPVTALGVGIGVDYALYILTVTLKELRAGRSLPDAYNQALLFTGKVVMLTGFSLSAAVMTWAFSPIKFQADMGILLAFMFMLNMVGAMVLLPALSTFLLGSGHRRGVSDSGVNAAGPARAAAANRPHAILEEDR